VSFFGPNGSMPRGQRSNFCMERHSTLSEGEGSA
jgi:hypothetical protein